MRLSKVTYALVAAGVVGGLATFYQQIDGVTDVEVGYHVRAELQGHGYATEAAAACHAYARDVLGVRRLIAIIHPDNVPSQRVAEKIGLAFERDHFSGAIDALQTAAEWRAAPAPR